MLFRTYKKPAWRPQYLGWHSCHPVGCKLSIFKSEARRHLLNCSCEVDFNAEIDFLRSELLKRGYPSFRLPVVRHSIAERQAFLQKLEDRKHGSRSSVQKNVLVLAADFSPQMQNLRLPHSIDELITKLRNRLGGAFFQGGATIVAYPSQNTIFQRTYRFQGGRG